MNMIGSGIHICFGLNKGLDRILLSDRHSNMKRCLRCCIPFIHAMLQEIRRTQASRKIMHTLVDKCMDVKSNHHRPWRLSVLLENWDASNCLLQALQLLAVNQKHMLCKKESNKLSFFVEFQIPDLNLLVQRTIDWNTQALFK